MTYKVDEFADRCVQRKMTDLRQSSIVIALTAIFIFAATGRVIAGPDAQTAQPGQTFRDCSDCPEMTVVPAGRFTMGSSLADTARAIETVPDYAVGLARTSMAYEHPEHVVSIPRAFALGKYDVTRAEFAAFVRAIGYSTKTGGCFVWVSHQYKKPAGAGWENPGFAQTDRDPVVCVSWHDAEAYVAWLNSKLGGRVAVSPDGGGPYHLPSEAEWEYAARAHTQTARWWGDVIGSGNANCDGCDSQWDKMKTAPVGSFRPNPFGLYDMLGNVSQWMSDCWHENYARAPDDGSPLRTGNCTQRVARGGNWTNEAWVLRSPARSRFDAVNLANYIGFRVAKTLP